MFPEGITPFTKSAALATGFIPSPSKITVQLYEAS
jgi:hypothetical protein